jgi:hypothetical protein
MRFKQAHIYRENQLRKPNPNQSPPAIGIVHQARQTAKTAHAPLNPSLIPSAEVVHVDSTRPGLKPASLSPATMIMGWRSRSQ